MAFASAPASRYLLKFLPWLSWMLGYKQKDGINPFLHKLLLHVRIEYINTGHVSSSPSEILLLHVSL